MAGNDGLILELVAWNDKFILEMQAAKGQ